MDKIQIGKIIEEGLKRNRLSKTALARKMKVSNSAVGQWIKGDSCPTAEKFLEIINFLQIEDLFFKHSSTQEKPIAEEIKEIKEAEKKVEKDVNDLKNAVKIIAERINVDIKF